MQYGVGASRRYAGYAAHTATIYAYTLDLSAPSHLVPCPRSLHSFDVVSFAWIEAASLMGVGTYIATAIEC
jgi:hypothetical protein